jgi:hypothetical protein
LLRSAARATAQPFPGGYRTRRAYGAQRAGAPQERPELDLGVAGQTRIGCVAARVRIREGGHQVAELLLRVLDVEGDAEQATNAASVLGLLAAAATRPRARSGGPTGYAGSQVDADEIVAGTLEQQGGDAGIDPAGHGDEEFHGAMW